MLRATATPRHALLFSLLVAAGCSSGSSEVKTETRCTDDSNCPAGQSCDTDRSVCIEGIFKDNHLRGRVKCTLGALDGEAMALGDVFVSGAIAGKRIEISVATGCGIEDGVVHVALSGHGATGRQWVALYVPTSVAGTEGEFAIEPYAFYVTDNHTMFTVQDIKGERVAPADPYLGFSLSGTGRMKSKAVVAGEVLSLEFDADVAIPQPQQTCEASCVSQADCGFAPGSEGTDYPMCEETFEGGPKVCTALCNKGTDGKACVGMGGVCTVIRCARPACGNLAPDLDCSTLKKEDCDTCCDLQHNKKWSQVFDDMIQQCGCAAGSPCEAACKTACSTSDATAFSKCSTCLGAPESEACRVTLYKGCAADASCSAYHDCYEGCK